MFLRCKCNHYCAFAAAGKSKEIQSPGKVWMVELLTFQVYKLWNAQAFVYEAYSVNV